MSSVELSVEKALPHLMPHTCAPTDQLIGTDTQQPVMQ